jgi:protein tyrosine phosphatase
VSRGFPGIFIYNSIFYIFDITKHNLRKFNIRYRNIIPYDENRVILQNPIKGVDYINASWIKKEKPGLPLPRFIAAQGPLPQTNPHFLQMIIENKVKIVVMLTKLSETEKGKSFYYISFPLGW